MMRTPLLAFITIILISVANLVYGTNYYVDTNNPNANDNNPGTESLPFKTIQKGIDVAFAGDTVFVKSGTYTPGTNGLDFQRSGESGNPIVIAGLGMPLVQFPSTSSPERGWDWGGIRNYIEIHGFEITGSKYAILIRGSHNKVVGNKVHDTGSDAIAIWGGDYNLYSRNEVYSAGWNALHIESRAEEGRSANYNIVEYNYVHDNPAHAGINIFPETSGIQDDLIGNIVRYNIINTAGMYTRCFKDGEIYGNLFYSTESSGDNTGLFLHTNEGTVPYPSNTKIYNNTFVNNKPYYALYNDSFKDLTIRNNIFISTYNGNSQAIVKMAYTSGVTMDYNLYHGNTTVISWGGSNLSFSGLQATGQETHGYFSDPQFGTDYRLTETSFARDKGTNLGTPYNFDLDNNQRGADGFWDIGAFEYSGSGGGNLPPNQPSNPGPSNGAIDQSIDVNLSWTCTDPNGDPLTYDVYLGTTNNPPLIASNISQSSYDPGTLNNQTTYYWKIVAEDNQGASTSGPVWNFTTVAGSGGDTIAPRLVNVEVLEYTSIRLTFSEPILGGSEVSNYSINNNISVLEAQYNNSQTTLTTSFHNLGQYTITVSNITDPSGNLIDPNYNTLDYEVSEIQELTLFTVSSVSASYSPEPNHTPDKTIDGVGYNGGDPDSRWASEPVPQWIRFDLGSEKNIGQTRLQFYNWNGGRIYDYSVEVSLDTLSWTNVVSHASSLTQEWNTNQFGPVTGKYVRVTLHSNNQNSWAGLWEGEIWGYDVATNNNTPPNNTVPEQYVLSQNYPNPFNPATRMNVQIPEATHLRLVVYNVIGEIVSIIADGEFEAGTHEFVFNSNGISSGMYIYRIESEKFSDSKKMIIMK